MGVKIKQIKFIWIMNAFNLLNLCRHISDCYYYFIHDSINTDVIWITGHTQDIRKSYSYTRHMHVLIKAKAAGMKSSWGILWHVKTWPRFLNVPWWNLRHTVAEMVRNLGTPAGSRSETCSCNVTRWTPVRNTDREADEVYLRFIVDDRGMEVDCGGQDGWRRVDRQ